MTFTLKHLDRSSTPSSDDALKKDTDTDSEREKEREIPFHGKLPISLFFASGKHDDRGSGEQHHFFPLSCTSVGQSTQAGRRRSAMSNARQMNPKNPKNKVK